MKVKIYYLSYSKRNWLGSWKFKLVSPLFLGWACFLNFYKWEAELGLRIFCFLIHSNHCWTLTFWSHVLRVVKIIRWDDRDSLQGDCIIRTCGALGTLPTWMGFGVSHCLLRMFWLLWLLAISALQKSFWPLYLKNQRFFFFISRL